MEYRANTIFKQAVKSIVFCVLCLVNKTSLNVFLLVFSNDTLLGEWENGGDVYLVIDKTKIKTSRQNHH